MQLALLFIISFSFIVILSSIFVYFFDKKIGIFVPLTFIIIAISYYYVGLLFGTFEYVKYLLIIYAVIGTVFFVKCIANKKINNVLTYGLLFLLIIFIFVFIYCYKYNISYFDEFSAWSPMVRSMYINNKFYTVCNGGGTHIEYPPFLSILELFFCNVYGAFSESVSSTSLHIVTFSFFIVPYIDTFKLNFVKSTLLFLFVVLTTILFGYNFRSLLVDVPLAFISSLPVILVVSNFVDSKFGIIYYALSLGCLLLTKQSGIGFYIFNLILLCILNKNTKNKKHFYIKLFFILLISLTMYLSWMVYIYSLGVGTKGQFSIFTIVSKVLSFNLNSARTRTFKNIIKAIFVGNMLEGKIYLPWFLFFVSIVLLYYVFDKKYKTNNKEIVYYILICTILYFIFLSILYCFGMEEHEAESLNSFFRYVSTYNIFLIFLFLVFNRENIDLMFISSTLVILLLLNIPNYQQFIPRIFIRGDINNESSRETIECGNYISSYLEQDAKILIVSDYNFTYFRLDYITMYNRNLFISDTFNEDCINLDILNNEEMVKEIKNYDYVVFYFKDGDIYNRMNTYFQKYNDKQDIYNYVVYKVDETNNNKLLNMMS